MIIEEAVCNELALNRNASLRTYVLFFSSIQQTHASIKHQDNKIQISPGSHAKVIVNGVQIVDETMLNHNDRFVSSPSPNIF